MLKQILPVMLVFCALCARGQYFQFSQYTFSQQRTNPASVANTDYASVSLLFRQQRTAPGTGVRSTFLETSYPLLAKRNGRRWAGFGLSVMDDQASGFFSTREIAGSYAVNTFLSRRQTLALGMKVLYQHRGIDLSGLVTGSQYITDRGFDRSMFNGETIGFLESDFVTFSAGMQWQQTNRDGDRISWLGFSFFDFNKPQDSFSGVDSQLSGTAVFEGGVRVIERLNTALSPVVLYTLTAATHRLNIGVVSSYFIRPRPNHVAARVDFLTTYVPGRSAIVGLQFHADNLSLGCSADLPVIRQNAANTHAFEVGVKLRRLVSRASRPRTTARRQPNNRTRPVQAKTDPAASARTSSGSSEAKDSVSIEAGGSDSTAMRQTAVAQKENLRARVQHKNDSIVASAEAGKMIQHPVIIERATLHFNFAFNSAVLDEESEAYLDELATVLIENPRLLLKLEGHTDNVGSAEYNLRLSRIRARQIRNFLVGKGIGHERIEAEGKGLTEPLNDNATDEERALNRRVELTLVYE